MCRLVRIPQCNFNIFQGNTPSSLFLTFHLKPSSVATENNRKTKGNPWTFLQHFTNSYSMGCRLILTLHKDHKYPLCGGGAVGHLLDPAPLLWVHCAHPPAPRPPCGLSSGLFSNTLQDNILLPNPTSFLPPQVWSHFPINPGTQTSVTASVSRETELRHWHAHHSKSWQLT